ncbi:ead/Ea22-like family protein [Escherichia coli]|uniref:ead/Ea22-like family protein n=1 Tax=Escherichia coli TaxID=562 RepID=UPI0039C97BA1
MSIIDRHELRQLAEKAISEEGETWWSEGQLASDYGLALHKADAAFIAAANPATVLALLDELEAAVKQNAQDVQIKARLCRESNSLHDRLRDAEKRNEELEARTATVTLPMPYDINVAGERIDWDKGDHFDRDEVIEALHAAGIKIKGE